MILGPGRLKAKAYTTRGLASIEALTDPCFTGLLRSVIFLAILLIAAPAAADAYTYVRLGGVNVEGSSRDNPLNLALNFGYELDSYVADLSIAAEINRTIDDGEASRGGELEFESNGLYLIYKSTRSLFAVARIGLVENKIIKRGNTERSDGFALGGGIGVVIGRTRLQLELTSYTGHAKLFTLGLQF
jgi:hypothetical protein